MKVNSRVASLFVSALSQSMPVELMQKVARMIIPNYDIYERSGFPSAIGMPRADAARHILKDFSREGYLVKFVESLIEVTTHGFMSREVRIPLLPRIIAELEGQGYRYSAAKGIFVEAGEHERTMGWGTLREDTPMSSLSCASTSWAIPRCCAVIHKARWLTHMQE